MKGKLLLLLLILSGMEGNAQCGTPPPPGLTYVYGLDTDNDGYALFDIQYFIDHTDRPAMENYFGASSSGYTATFRNRSGVAQPMLYTNTSQNQECGIEYTYNGSGPIFQPQPPCYWPVEFYFGSRGLQLITVSFDADEDNDGITNSDEDSNRNGNVMDDDDDLDGIINLKDNFNNLSIDPHRNIELSLFPNPVTNGILNFECNVAISSVSIFDLTGKQLLDTKITSKLIPVDMLADGVYLLKLESDKGSVYRKIAVSK